MKTLRVMGCDPGLASLGYGIVDLEGSEWALVASGCIVTLPSQSDCARYAEIASDLAQLVACYEPDLAAYELITVTPGLGNSLAQALKSSGVIAAVFGAAGVPTVQYPPQSWKSGVVPRMLGGGRAKKDDVKAAVRDLLRLDYLPRTEHEADALCIAIHRGNRMGLE